MTLTSVNYQGVLLFCERVVFNIINLHNFNATRIKLQNGLGCLWAVLTFDSPLFISFKSNILFENKKENSIGMVVNCLYGGIDQRICPNISLQHGA